jgi:hypothetical protein
MMLAAIPQPLGRILEIGVAQLDILGANCFPFNVAIASILT